jgi:hypothetical protein
MVEALRSETADPNLALLGPVETGKRPRALAGFHVEVRLLL